MSLSSIERLVRAWNGRDAAAFAALFAPDATYVRRDGDVLRGREAIASLVQPGLTIEVVAVTANGFEWRSGEERGAIEIEWNERGEIAMLRSGTWTMPRSVRTAP